MKYSKKEKELILDIKKSNINEFRYHSRGGWYNGVEEICDLEEAFLVGLNTREDELLKTLDFADLSNEALYELNSEGIIAFINNKEIVITKLCIEKYIFPDKMYE